MKFEFGQWQLLPNVQAIYPRTVTDIRVEDNGNALVVAGYDHEIKQRSSYLHGTLVVARFTAPLPNVIRVQLTHHKGLLLRQPNFDLDYSRTNPDVEIGVDDEKGWLKSGNLTVVVDRQQSWSYQFIRDGVPLTGSEWHATAFMTKDRENYLREQLSLSASETVYGLGERFSAFSKNGQSIDTWNEDGGTLSEYAYKNIPFYVTSQGYGVLVNHPERVSFEVASHHVSRVQFSTAGHALDYYLFGGPTIKDTLSQYTTLSGRPPQLPDWSFGLWVSTSFTTNYDEAKIIANIERMESLGIPISVFHFDCFWMRELTWSGLEWDPRNFPDPARLIQRIKSKGIRVCLWINPYIAEEAPMFAEGAAAGYLLKTPQGDTYQIDDWQPGIGFVDFTNPSASKWFTGKLRTLLDMGVDCFKTDFGERIPTDVRYFDGSDPERMHNYYSYLYNQTVYNLLREVKGEGEAVLFARSATVGGQKYPIHWGGDSTSSYPSMAETLRGGLSLGLCGFGYWSHDISGFNETASPDLYKRWVAFGLMSSHSRLHGSNSARFPWLFDEQAPDVLRHFVALKSQLMPYLHHVAGEAQANGWPMMRAMLMEFPADPTCRYLDMQYMLGDALLVAPVFSPDSMVTYYLPQGTWRNLLTGEVASSGWRTECHDYYSLPLWVQVEKGKAWKCLDGVRLL